MIDKVILLAGGKSRRFYPFSSKLFWSFFQKPFILHQYELISGYFPQVYIVADSSLKEQFYRFFPKDKIIFQKPSLSGQAGAVLSAAEKIGVKGSVLILNANDLLDDVMLNLVDQLKKIQEKKIWGFLAGFYSREYFDGGYLVFDKDDRVVNVVEKPGAGNQPSDYVKAVFDYYSSFKDLVDALKKEAEGDPDSWYERALSRLLKIKFFSVLRFEKRLLSLKYPWDILRFTEHYLQRLRTSEIKGNIAKTAVIEGAVFIDEDVKVGQFAKISGPCYISKGTVIGDYALVRGSFLGKNVVVGAHSEVVRSYLRSGVMLHRNYVGDSVLDKGVLFGAGAITANFRFDQKEICSNHLKGRICSGKDKLGVFAGAYAKVGVNTTIYPGRIIGKNTWIAPGSVIKDNLDEGRFFINGKVKNNKGL